MPDQPVSESHFKRPLLRTPFHERTSALCQTDAFIAWAGYTTVDVFTTVEQEYFSIRNTASLYDLSPMIKYRIAGPDAERFLNRLVTRDVRKIKIGRVAYAVWCDDNGRVIDDGTIFRFDQHEFRLCSQERQLDWLLDSAIGFDVEIADVTAAITGLSLQGPTSCALLKYLGLGGIETLKPFEIRDVTLAGFPLTISRTGFTGDLGYELWVSPDHALPLWDQLMAGGHRRGLRPIGSAALNMARLEAGFLSPGVDFISANGVIFADRARSPFELGLGWTVDFDKGHFNGRRALVEEQRLGASRVRLVGLEIEGDKPAGNALVYADAKGAKEIGSITSSMWSPTCKRNIALALIKTPEVDRLQSFWTEIYRNRELVWQRRMKRSWIVERPFFAPERRRATPALDR